MSEILTKACRAFNRAGIPSNEWSMGGNIRAQGVKQATHDDLIEDGGDDVLVFSGAFERVMHAAIALFRCLDKVACQE